LFYGRGSALLQYWRSFEGLERFARDPEDPHMPAWQRFNREARSSGAVGIWHETYIVGAATTRRSTPTCPSSEAGKPRAAVYSDGQKH
jgi:hypothetical protein